MELSRRCFLRNTGIATLAVVATPAILTLQGCPISQSQLVQLVNEIGTGINSILPYLQSVDAATSAKIQGIFADLKADVAAWTSGSDISKIEQVVNDLVAAMALFPVAQAYQPLVALIVATAEGIITLLVPGSTPPAAIGRYQHYYAKPPKTAAQFHKEWMKIVHADSRLAGYAI